MKKTLNRVFILFITPCLLLISACSGGENSKSDSLNVVVSFDALYEIAIAVGGERADVTKIIPDGAELHDFEPKAKDLNSLSDADIFIINGLGLEPWAEDAVSASGNSSLTVIDLSEISSHIEPIELSGGGYDPHIWLSPKCAASMAKTIRMAFADADPDGLRIYLDNCAEFMSQLNNLTDIYSEKFDALEKKTIVSGHAVFAYLCRDFGLTQNSAEGVFAEGEPSARRLAELIEYCREHDVKTVLAEELASPLVSETLAREAGASVETVYTMESAEDSLTYLERMSANLRVICESLS